jgi:uncharacterized membrane protein YvbJ
MVKKTADLQAENEALQARVKTLEALQTPQVKDPGLDKYMAELNKIKVTARNEGNSIKVQEFADHKNISLWTKDGKRIGPLHQTNALRTFELFHQLGTELSVDRPTAQQIADYKESPEYKAWLTKHLKKRAIKDRTRKSGQMEKLTAEIAKLAGTTVDAVNKILAPGQVVKVNDHLK